MAGTNAAAAMDRLVGESNVLAGLTGMEDVTVAYDVPRDAKRKMVYAGGIGGPIEPSAMRGNSRIKREENLRFELVIRVSTPGQSNRRVVNNEAVAICNIIENYVAANPTLGGLSNLLLATTEEFQLTGGLNDDTAVAQVVLTIGLKSFLS